MGIVGEYLRGLITKQVDDRGLVVWFDPEQHYAEFVSTLTLPGTTIVRYDASFIALRHQISPLLENEEPPRLLVYVPLAEDATQDALVELTAAGAVIKPGQQPWQRNTRLSVVTRAALKDTFGPDQIKILERQIEAGQLATLEEVEASIERIHQQANPGVIALIFDTSEPEEVALAFLCDTRYDETIVAKGAQPDVATVLGDYYGIELPSAPLDELRIQLARHMLCTDLLATLNAPVPAQLVSLRVATATNTREACCHLARRWRHDRELGDAYARYADQVERELDLASIPFSLDQIRDCDTFAAIEGAVEETAERAWIAQPSADLLGLSNARLRGFWVQRQPAMQARWSLIDSAGRLLLRSADIETALKQNGLLAESLIRNYIGGDDPWCELDTWHRELEQRSRRFDFTADHEPLTQLLARARRRYMDIGDQLAVHFTQALAAEDFRLPSFIRQRDVFQRFVAPSVKEGKTAYILVDALRYEIAREIARGLSDTFNIQLDAAVGSVPTITEIGMASLLPDVSEHVEVVAAGSGKLGLQIGQTLLRDRASRLAWLRAHAPTAADMSRARVVDMALDDLLAPKPALKAEITAADLVVVTSPEIDAVSEMDNISLARALMDNLLDHLVRGIRRLVELGCQRIILVADHGYLFGEELDSAMKIDSPGGQTLDLHRRVWVGRGGASSPAYLRAPLSAFDLSATDLEIAVPWGFGAFKTQGGARAYFHGGLSLPELIVPVATLTPIRTHTSTAVTGDIEWSLVLGSRHITTRVCSLTISGHRSSLFAVDVPPVRVEIHSGREVVSTPRFATYGLNALTQEIQLQFSEHDETELEPSTIMLEIEPERVRGDTVTISLLDVRTGRELKRLDAVEMRIAIQ